jgi:nicotinate-nucleotide adenylyltransferase
MTRRRIALFGGSFDPIHLGHTTVAASAAEQIRAEKVFFIPAKCSPLKSLCPHAGDEDRLAMVTLATADNEAFAVSDIELKRPAPSFTIDTVRLFQREYGEDTAIHWLLGADSVGDLMHWYEIGELIDECNLTTMQRAGHSPPDFGRFESLWGPQRVAKLRRNVVQTPLIDISSTEVRRRLAAREDVSGMLHPNVIRYIREHGLYGAMQSRGL